VTAKAVIPRASARHDIDEAVDYYANDAGVEGALRFVDALQDAYHAISVRPASGSPRYAHELDLPGLRSRKLARFPHMIVYLERSDHIDVWRVLHVRRDIASWMGK
jgi:toxin ParE1/3/4